MTTTRPTHDDLVRAAVAWLRRSPQSCAVAVPELVTYAGEAPDAVGWRDQGRTCIVVECKTSRADFLHDRRKSSRRFPERAAGNRRYYLTPPGLLNPRDMPTDDRGATWGLIELHGRSVRKITGSSAFTISADNSASQMMMFSLLRRSTLRGSLTACLAPKWGGDGWDQSARNAPADTLADMGQPGEAMNRARRLAGHRTLRGIDYLGADGKPGARGPAVKLVRLKFDNDETVELTPHEMTMLRDVSFKLSERAK